MKTQFSYECTRNEETLSQDHKGCEICMVTGCGYSRCFEPDPRRTGVGNCLYEHCIENMPLFENNIVGCSVFGHDCPGGIEQVKVCRRSVQT